MNSILLFALSAALVFALGNILQKTGMNREAPRSPKGVVGWGSRLLRSPFWLLGIFFSSVGALLQYYSMAHWNISLVQPLIGINPVLTALLGWLILKEKVAAHVWVALFFALLGVVSMGMVGPEQPGVWSDWLWVVVAILGGAMVLLHLVHKGSGELRYGVAAGLGFGLSVVLYKAVVLTLEPFFEAPVSELLMALLNSPAAWSYLVVYLAAFFLSQAALSQGRASVVIPLASVIGSTLPVASGILLFGEPLSLVKGLSLLFFVLALLLFFFGESLFSSRVKGSSI